MRHLAAALLVTVCCSPVLAQNWGQWRGPYFDGSSPATDLPSKWSLGDGVVWRAALPGPSAATPVVWDERVFVSSTDPENGTLRALCYDRTSGKLLWEDSIGESISQDIRSTYSAPSPATDGELVVFFYGNGDLVTYDVEGNQKWAKNIGPFAFQWTFSTSPLLYEGRLYMQILQRDEPVNGRGGQTNESYLLALDPETGDELWRHVRPSKAFAESLEAFTTPIPFAHNGREEILIAGGDALTGHNPATGEELWRWGTWNPTRIGHWRLVPSPVASEDVILVCAPKRDPIYAIRAGETGELGDDAVLWVSRRQRVISSDVPTPAYYDGDFFVLNKDRKVLSRVEPSTGNLKWTTEKLGQADFEASPTAADGKIYVVDFDGVVSVIDAASGRRLHRIAMEPERDENVVRSTIVVAHGHLFVRTNSYLYCIGQ